MKKINLLKYGFERAENLDFSDDGNHFRCYVLEGIEISYLKSNDYVYISGHSSPLKNALLTYAEYSKLPHYRSLDKLNGKYRSDEITDEMLQEFADDVRAYAKEYKEAISDIKIPTAAEVQKHYLALHELVKNELKDINNKYSLEQLAALPESKYGIIIARLKSLRSELNTYQDRATKAEEIKTLPFVINDLRKSCEILTNRKNNKSWYYTEVVDIMSNI